jgi:hypothetical protein
MSNQHKKNRPVTGFRLDPETLDQFQVRLRERGMAMQPTLEAWVKRWLETGEPFPDDILIQVRRGQEELRALVEDLARQRDPQPPREPSADRPKSSEKEPS